VLGTAAADISVVFCRALASLDISFNNIGSEATKEAYEAIQLKLPTGYQADWQAGLSYPAFQSRSSAALEELQLLCARRGVKLTNEPVVGKL
jgi:hypothetical protein